MSTHAVDNVNKIDAEAASSSNATTKKIGEASAAKVSETQDKAETFLKKEAAMLGAAGHSSLAGFQELAEAYQEVASKNSARLTESIKELSSLKSPVDFVAYQQKFVKQAFEDALADGKYIAETTVAAFTTAFEPMKKNLAAIRSATPHSARSGL